MWKKIGLIFDLEKHPVSWLRSHAMLPTPLLLEDRIRVYFTGRDEKGLSRISFVDLDPSDPAHILYVHDRPLLGIGKPGTFDDSGTIGTWAVRNGDRVYLYYNGYNRRVTVPWSNAIGLAVSKDGGTVFERFFEGPIVDRNEREPYFAISAYVLREDDLWRMWYASGTGWVKIKDRMEALYVIKYAHSADGIAWKRENITCIHPLTDYEANARAAVIKEGPVYKMWFCYRGSEDFRDGVDSYRIGCAESSDGVHWIRDDRKSGIARDAGGWDSKMQAYPAVIAVNGKKYLFYNGNGFGSAGFGCAMWCDEKN